MKHLRTTSTSRLISGAAIVLIALIGAVAAIAATRGSGTTPPPKPLANAIHDALAAGRPDGITANISFTNNLLPSSALGGQGGSPLLTGASGRLFANASGGRLELQSDSGSGDSQIVWSDGKVTVYDGSSNTAYVFTLPAQTGSSSSTSGAAIPSIDQITSFLTKAAQHWSISGAQPSNVGHQPAYTVTVSPTTSAGLLGSAELAWDALHGVPLKLAIYARGATSPALSLEATDISYGPVSSSDIQISPPAGAKIVDLSSHASGSGTTDAKTPPVTGLAAVQQAAPFAVVAPSALDGQPLSDIRLVHGKTVIAVYGQGLGALVVVERAQQAQKGGTAGALGQLPTVSLDGVTGHELATPLGTVVLWDRGGVAYVLAGSVSSAGAEAAANALK